MTNKEVDLNQVFTQRFLKYSKNVIMLVFLEKLARQRFSNGVYNENDYWPLLGDNGFGDRVANYWCVLRLKRYKLNMLVFEYKKWKRRTKNRVQLVDCNLWYSFEKMSR